MKFRTEIEIEPYDAKIMHDEKIATFGSCFAENIAEKFDYYKFDILKNPFGVLYNPASIANSLSLVFNKKKFTRDDLIFHQGEFHSFYHHSDFSHHDVDTCLTRINKGLERAEAFLRQANWTFLTLGTAYVYKHKERDIIVSNCHKIPQNQFERFRLNVSETKKEIVRSVKYLKLLNENIRIVLTVSPVRHWKDGAIENQRSKATLLLAVEEVLRECGDVYYFPSYELITDDLRDYRFYETDLLHPNAVATAYIWEKLSVAFFDDETRRLLARIEKIVRGLNHRPRNPNSPKHKEFTEKLKSQIETLVKEFPYLEQRFR